MSRRVLVGFIVVNVIVSLVVAMVIVRVDRSRRPSEPQEGPTQIVILTATPLPGFMLEPAEYQSTIDSLLLTGTALYQRAEVVAVVTATPPGGIDPVVPGVTAVATIDPAILPPVPSDLPPGLPSPTLQNDGCIRHEVQSGEVISVIAQQYGVFPGDILLANNMTEDDVFNLQIGDILIIPVEGCTALTTPTAAPVPSNTPFALVRPTVTLPPTAVNAQVVVANVLEWGNVNGEAVEIRNLGNVINLQGWTLVNASGDTFRFPEFRMQQGSLVRVFSRQGQNTPAALYWGRETPAWNTGDTVTLNDSLGQIQATFRVGETQPLFQEITPGAPG
ncbi:MAG: lamin tail domain-containing protein [Chloroflexi bacterium]|nr:lamin tail domain-containing protein [Chloroflexota bacterium]